MRHLTRDGVRFGFVDIGKGAPPIVLVPDRGADHTSFAPQIERLRRGHRVVAVDLPAQEPGGGSESSGFVAGLADGLARLLYDLGVYLPVVVGRGFGGLLALDLAARHPDLLAGVVAVGSPGLETTGTPRLDLSGLEPADRLSAAVEAFAARVRPGDSEAGR